jgi:hypothetical protein
MRQARKFLGKKVFRLALVLFFIFMIGAFLLIKERIQEVKAGEDDNVGGWAWSENFGWFSGNCSNLGVCPGAGLPIDYGLNVDESGWVNGYLWSEHLGWVQFGNGLSGMPAPADQARYDKASDKVSGWAKVLALGDDGWLKLRGNIVAAGSGPYRQCSDCEDVLDGEGNPIDVACQICFGSEAYGGSGKICNNCSGCVRGAETQCGTCTDCNAYGVAIDGQSGRMVGWAWNGNSDPAVGAGWINFSPTAAGLGLAAPWLETIYGEIYGKPFVRSPSAFVEVLGKYNATYCVLTTGQITHFTSKEGCLVTPFESFDFPKTSNLYTNVFGKVDLAGILAGKYGTVENIGDENGIQSVLAGKVYFSDGDLTITGKTFNNGTGSQNGAGLIVVRGDLNINGAIAYQNAGVLNLKNLASVGWLVVKRDDGTGGNIVINQNVENIVGAFYAENEVTTGTTYDWRTDKPLTVRGLILAREFDFQRLYQSAQRGSEQVIYDGRVLANTPPGMADLARALPTWREAAP